MRACQVSRRYSRTVRLSNHSGTTIVSSPLIVIFATRKTSASTRVHALRRLIISPLHNVSSAPLVLTGSVHELNRQAFLPINPFKNRHQISILYITHVDTISLPNPAQD